MLQDPMRVAEAAPAVFPTRSGLRLAADVIGEGPRGVVMLAHGGGQTRHAWASTAERLAERGWRAVSLDLRGHGQSEWAPDGDYAIARFAEDLVDVARSMGGRPALIGASLGGMAGLAVETQVAPGTFSSLTLVDIVPRSDPEGVARIMGFMGANLEHGFDSLEAASDAIAAYLPHRPRPTDLSGLRKNLRLGADGRWRWHWDPGFVTGMSRRRAADALAEPRYEDMDLPVHLIRGRMSELVSPEAAEAFVAILPNGSFTDVADAGHMVAGDRNDAFLEAALAFLETQPAEQSRKRS
jgi:pimeloyl-ACP methyl ester carboxylesterase